MKILECSSAGDKRFSALYATVTIFGVTDTIENHYQNCKCFWYYKGNPKGKSPDYISINGLDLDTKYLSNYYDLLWVRYFDENPKLVEYVKSFDDFHDKFKSKRSLNCQADTIRKYVKCGRDGIMTESQGLLKILKKRGKL